MKRAWIMFALLVLAANAGAARERGLPTNVCSGSFCGPSQARIWTRFQQSPELDLDDMPGVYSGVCFHNSPRLDGNRVHYGGVLVDRMHDRLYFDGRFSFYTGRNPYAHLSMSKARSRFGNPFRPARELGINRTYAVADLADRFVSRRYWFRQDRVNDGLVMVGYFGPVHTVLCDLRRNRRHR